MKKIVSILLCLSILTLAGCARSDQAEKDDKPLPSETQSENPTHDGPHASGGAWAIDGVTPQELKRSGRMRGNIALFMRVDIGTVELAANTVARFDLTSSKEDAALRFLLTNAETGEVVEGTVTGSGGLTLKITAAGPYVLTLENLSELDVYFTVDYAFGGTPI